MSTARHVIISLLVINMLTHGRDSTYSYLTHDVAVHLHCKATLASGFKKSDITLTTTIPYPNLFSFRDLSYTHTIYTHDTRTLCVLPNRWWQFINKQMYWPKRTP